MSLEQRVKMRRRKAPMVGRVRQNQSEDRLFVDPGCSRVRSVDERHMVDREDCGG